MTRSILLAIGLALAGCGSTPVQLPDGRTGQAIECGRISECMNEAAKICGGPYEVINSGSGTTAGIPGHTTTRQVYNPSTGNTDTVAHQRRGIPSMSYAELVFICGSPVEADQTPESVKP
jgi:hypothetical protein